MTEYLVPHSDAESEFVEKRSRFITHLWKVESEAEARSRIEEMKKKYYDARHNCWCYLLQEGNVVRYSDDGEPQGTAGQPMLNVFQRQSVTNVCCVVTRYFGGILLGAGGLTRAYTKGAKDALDVAGIARMSLWTLWEVECTYPLFERMKQAFNPDGIFLSNGPGSPEELPQIVELIKSVKGKVPMFGISLGMQLIALAYGAECRKMKCGHHGGAAVKDLATGRIDMTAQNHGYEVVAESVKGTCLEITHVNIPDGSVEGVECAADKVYGVQFHPESAPGPQDSVYLFDKFIKLMEEKQNA